MCDLGEVLACESTAARVWRVETVVGETPAVVVDEELDVVLLRTIDEKVDRSVNEDVPRCRLGSEVSLYRRSANEAGVEAVQATSDTSIPCELPSPFR